MRARTAGIFTVLCSLACGGEGADLDNDAPPAAVDAVAAVDDAAPPDAAPPADAPATPSPFRNGDPWSDVADVSAALVEFCSGVTADGKFKGTTVNPVGSHEDWDGTWSATRKKLTFQGRRHGFLRGMQSPNEDQSDAPFDEPFSIEMTGLYPVEHGLQLAIVGTLASPTLEKSGRVMMTCEKPDPHPDPNEVNDIPWEVTGWIPTLSDDSHWTILDAGGGPDATAAVAAMVREKGGLRGGDVVVYDGGKARNARDSVEIMVRDDSHDMDSTIKFFETRFSKVTLKTWPEATDEFTIAVGIAPDR